MWKKMSEDKLMFIGTGCTQTGGDSQHKSLYSHNYPPLNYNQKPQEMGDLLEDESLVDKFLNLFRKRPASNVDNRTDGTPSGCGSNE